MIIETSANQLYRVHEVDHTTHPDLTHVWLGIAVKRVNGGFVDKKNAREELVRKAASRIIQN